jgi:4-aminobutyrate aminotransferase-like enzyme
MRTAVPGPQSRRLAEVLSRHESRNVTFLSENFPVFWQRAAGANVWDVDGNRYVDFTSAFGVATPGFSHPRVREAAVRQCERLWHGIGDVHPTAEKAALCRRLVQCTYGRSGAAARVILCSSGFEAVEAALKTAHLATGRSRFVAFRGGYHGLGFGAVDVTGWEFFRVPFRAVLAQCADFLPYPGCERCPLDALRTQLEALLSARRHAAVVVEPVLGRGGAVVPPPGFLRMLRKVTVDTGTLLIFDEIFTGFLRTGHWLACDAEQEMPDLLCLGKAMGGGFPISACVGDAAVMDCWPRSEGEALHTSTHLGNPLGCAMALAALDVLEDAGTVGRVRDTAAMLEAALRRVASSCSRRVRCVRGRGLLWGVELREGENFSAARKCAKLVTRGLGRGLLLLGGGERGNVLTLSPPAGLSQAQVDCLEQFLLGELSG